MAAKPHGYEPDLARIRLERVAHPNRVAVRAPCRHCTEIWSHRVHQPRWWRIFHPLAKWR